MIPPASVTVFGQLQIPALAVRPLRTKTAIGVGWRAAHARRNSGSLDHLICPRQQRAGDRDAEGLGGPEVDVKIVV